MDETKILTDATRVEKDLKTHTRIPAVRSVLPGSTTADRGDCRRDTAYRTGVDREV